MPRIHLIVGPVAAGKSTFARELSKQHRAVWLNLDEWMAQLFSPDRPDDGVMSWYTERTARCIEQIWRLTTSIIEAGNDVILEIGLIQRHDRERLYKRVTAKGYDLTVYALDAPRELRRERVQQRNQEKARHSRWSCPSTSSSWPATSGSHSEKTSATVETSTSCLQMHESSTAR